MEALNRPNGHLDVEAVAVLEEVAVGEGQDAAGAAHGEVLLVAVCQRVHKPRAGPQVRVDPGVGGQVGVGGLESQNLHPQVGGQQ